MTSAAKDYGLPNGSSLFQSLQAPFANAHGNPFSHPGQRTETAATTAANSNTEAFDTLDLKPPAPEEHILKSIQSLLDRGEFEKAAERLQAVLDRKNEFDFTPEQDGRLYSLIQQTQDLAAENAAQEWQHNGGLEILQFLAALPIKQKEVKDEMEDLVRSLTVAEGVALLDIGLGLF